MQSLEENQPDFSFESQLAKKDAIARGSGHRAIVHVTDLDPNLGPQSLDVRQRPEVPVLISPSILTASGVIDNAMRAFWQHGKRTIVVDHARKNLRSDSLSEHTHPGLSKIQLGRMASLSAVLDAKNVEQADVVGLCEGAINASYLALLQPERVRSLILVNPAGVGEDSLSRLLHFFAARTAGDARKKISGARSQFGKARDYSPMLHYASNPLSRLRTLRDVAHTRIDPLFAEIESAGVPVGVIKGSTDTLYPADQAEKYLQAGSISRYEVLDHPRSGHSPLISLPNLSVQTIVTMQDKMGC